MNTVRTSVLALALAAVPVAGAAGNPVAGKAVFENPRNFCGSCHTLKDAGTKGRAGPDLDRTRPTYARGVRTLVLGARSSRRYPAGMPAYAKTLSAKQIRDVSAYVARASRR